jgi:hypothetical protein
MKASKRAGGRKDALEMFRAPSLHAHVYACAHARGGKEKRRRERNRKKNKIRGGERERERERESEREDKRFSKCNFSLMDEKDALNERCVSLTEEKRKKHAHPELLVCSLY